MKDPMRLIEADGTEFERLLLHAAAREVPAPEISARMLAGAASAGAAVALLSSLELGGSGGAVTSSAALTSSSALGSSSAQAAGAVLGGASGSMAPPAAAGLFGTWLVKWGVLGVLLLGAGAAGVLVVRGEKATTVALSGPPLVEGHRSAAASPEGKPAPLALASEVRDAKSETESPSAARAVRAGPPSLPASAGPSSLGPSSLGQQVALLDAAREALTAGDAERALGLIASYHRRFPSGALEQEATVLEVDALEAKGRAAQATNLKEQFLAEHPESAHRERVQRSGKTQ